MTLEHQKDEVLVMLFWNTVNNDSVAAMKSIHASMESNAEKWKGKVRFVTLSIDSEVQYPINDTKAFTRATHCNVL